MTKKERDRPASTPAGQKTNRRKGLKKLTSKRSRDKEVSSGRRKKKKKSKHRGLLSAVDVKNWKVEPQRWLVRPLIPQGGHGYLSALPKVGKSLLALDLSIHLVCGVKWLDQFAVKKTRVLYINREDSLGRIQKRLIEIASGYGCRLSPRRRQPCPS